MTESRVIVDESVFELGRAELDALPFGVVTLDRSGKILRYNRAEENLARRSAAETIGLDFFHDVAPCTNVQAFRGRFDEFAAQRDGGAERFDFSFAFRWGRHDVSITMLRMAGREEINILVRGRSIAEMESGELFERRGRRERPRQRTDAERLFGARALELPSLSCRLGTADEIELRRHIHPDDRATVDELLTAARRTHAPYAIEYRVVRPDHTVAVISEFGCYTGPSDAIGQATVVDVTARRALEDENWRAARYDAVTGLPNRRLLLDRLAEAVAEAQAERRIAALILANLETIHDINASFGHDVGDELLREISMRLGECVRGGDTVARLDADTFAILLTGIDTGLSVSDTAGRLISALTRPFEDDERSYFLSVSTGVSLAPSDAVDPESLIRCADLAVRAARARGSNEICWYGSELADEQQLRAERQNELRAALSNGEFTAVYQPIVDVVHGRVVAVEALARWNHPTRVVTPLEFIGLADRTGLIVPLGEWMMREACRQAQEWVERGHDLRVCVNVSAVQFRQANFAELVADVLATSGIAPERLELELTESVMVDGFGEMMETLGELKTLGVRLAIDDFGTGYSSLAYLKYFPVDTLKIDRAFVTDIVGGGFDRAIATAVLTLAQQLGLDCVVEGVEGADQLDALRAIGCTLVQGYYLSRPVSPACLEESLGTQPFGPLARADQ